MSNPKPHEPRRLSNFPFALVLFDFDGTLADSYPAIAASVNFVRTHYKMDALGVEVIKRFVGRGAQHLLQNTVPGAPTEDAYRLYAEHHPTVLQSGTELLAGSLDVLHLLRNLGVDCGICSNKPVRFTRELVKGLAIADHFQVVLGPEDVPNRKPAPDMVQEAMRRTGHRADKTLYVGDMSVDIETGRGAGVQVWCVATGSETREQIESAGPDRLFADMTELARVLAGA